MKWSQIMSACVFMALLATRIAEAQGTGVPFLTIPSSPEGNGMGGIAASLVSDNAFASVANPAQLGLFSLENYLSIATYVPRTEWLPSFTGDIHLDASALNTGFKLNSFINLPAPISFGLAYSQTYFKIDGLAVSINDVGVPPITESSYEKCDNLGFGIGLDYKIKFGIGYTFKWIDSELIPYGTEQEPVSPLVAKLPAHDFGILLKIPLEEIIRDGNGDPIQLNDKIGPVVDASFAYALKNVGGYVSYGLPGGSDPLPRQSVMGLNVEMGLESRIDGHPLKLFTFTLAREVEAILITTVKGKADVSPSGDTTYNWNNVYRSGSGGLRPFDNLIEGINNGTLYLQKGWQFQVAECIYVRGGSYTAPGLVYATSGASFKLNGFFRLLSSLNLLETPSGIISFLTDHIDVQYHFSEYRSLSNPVGGTTFSEINIVLK